jgi:hypothetical protein
MQLALTAGGAKRRIKKFHFMATRDPNQPRNWVARIDLDGESFTVPKNVIVGMFVLPGYNTKNLFKTSFSNGTASANLKTAETLMRSPFVALYTEGDEVPNVLLADNAAGLEYTRYTLENHIRELNTKELHMMMINSPLDITPTQLNKPDLLTKLQHIQVGAIKAHLNFLKIMNRLRNSHDVAEKVILLSELVQRPKSSSKKFVKGVLSTLFIAPSIRQDEKRVVNDFFNGKHNNLEKAVRLYRSGYLPHKSPRPMDAISRLHRAAQNKTLQYVMDFFYKTRWWATGLGVTAFFSMGLSSVATIFPIIFVILGTLVIRVLDALTYKTPKSAKVSTTDLINHSTKFLNFLLGVKRPLNRNLEKRAIQYLKNMGHPFYK